MGKKKIVVINLGSTSTKIGYYEDDERLVGENLPHPAQELSAYKTVWQQLDMRRAAIDEFLGRHGIPVPELDAFVTRGGHTQPLKGGVYRITQKMLEQSASEKWGNHVCDLGLVLATEYARQGPAPLTVNPPSTDEFEPLARYSGLPEIPRESHFHALSHKAVGEKYARDNGKSYEELNLVVCHMGGGISVAAHKQGQMVDANNALDGEGPFSTNRCCGVPVGGLVDLCYSGKYSHTEMRRRLNGDGGMMAYLGENDTLTVQNRAKGGDEKADEVLRAMCYQVGKEIAAMAAVMNGKVDAIVFTGGMANSEFLINNIYEMVRFIAPLAVYPGEFEMESLSSGAYQAMLGKRPIQEL